MTVVYVATLWSAVMWIVKAIIAICIVDVLIILWILWLQWRARKNPGRYYYRY